MVALDNPPARGGIQTYLSELARRLPVHVIAPGPESADGVERVGARAGWAAVPALAARTAARLAGGGFAGVVLGHPKLAAALPLFARGGLRTLVCTYGMEVTSGRFKALERFGLKRAWRVATISEYTAQHLVRLGVAPERLRRVPPGVALPGPPPARDGGGAPVLLSVGRLERSEGYKGHARVLDALPALSVRFPGLRWVVAGAGSGLADLADQVRVRGLGAHVELKGAVDARELARLYGSADVFVLPTEVLVERGQERFEGFGIVYLEAAAYGCPVVATRAGGTPDAVADGETGILVEPGRPAELLDALGRLLADSSLRRRMGEAGRARVERGFTWEHAAAKLAAVLAEAP